MSTHSSIGYQDPKTGLFHFSYCHWDGYMSHNGKILRDHYKTLTKVKQLVNLGSISVLKKNIKPPKNPQQAKFEVDNETGNGKWIAIPIEKHTFHTPDRDTVVAYHRDRGEKWEHVKPEVSNVFNLQEEWAYCFINNKWHFKNSNNRRKWQEIPAGDLAKVEETVC